MKLESVVSVVLSQILGTDLTQVFRSWGTLRYGFVQSHTGQDGRGPCGQKGSFRAATFWFS